LSIGSRADLQDEAVQCLGYADFEREFGGIDSDSAASYGIKQFFQNGGSECWVVRVGTTRRSAPTMPSEARTVVDRRTRRAPAIPCSVCSPGARLRGEIAINPGVWGDMRCSSISTHETSDVRKALFNMTVSEVALVSNGVRRSVLRSETYPQPDDGRGLA
jgi:hypothetical protein